MIYVRINKAGSTSVSNFVKDCCSILQVSKIKQRVDRLGGWLDKERIKNETCFTVARNPFSRAVSQWQHCVRLGNDYTFEDWLEKDFHQMEPKERAHSIRQVDYLFDCAGSLAWIDFILKLEDNHLEKSLRELTGATGKLERRAKGDYNHKAEHYTEYAKEMVKAKYYLDFKLLGYDNKY